MEHENFYHPRSLIYLNSDIPRNEQGLKENE